MSDRKKVPTQTEIDLFLKSKRRCCICYYLDNDLREKQGQVAHLDQNRNNNKFDNLAFLCLPHHDKYDTKTRQSKNYTEAEVKTYRKLLYEYWEEQNKNIKIEDYKAYLQNAINLKSKNPQDKIIDDTITFKVSDLEVAEQQFVLLELWNDGEYEIIINRIIMEHKFPFHASSNNDWVDIPVKGLGNNPTYRYQNINFKDFELAASNHVFIQYDFPSVRANILQQSYPLQIDFKIDVTIPSKEFDYEVSDIKREVEKTIFFKFEQES